MKGERQNRLNIRWVVAVMLLSTSAPAQVIQYNYGMIPAHAPHFDSFYNYLYDRNGNLTQITDRYTSAVKQRLEYNSLNKLLRATVGSAVTEYRYDANGNRIEKIGPVGTEKYYGLIEAKGNTKTYYYFLGSRRVAQRTIGGNQYFHHQDHLGSASVLTDSNGAVQSRTSYHEFGSIKYQEGQGGLSDYTYNGKRWDKETNFYDYGARAYNAKMFKFTTPDSIVPDPKNPQSLNRYAYVKNNPLRYLDPSGHASIDPSGSPFNGLQGILQGANGTTLQWTRTTGFPENHVVGYEGLDTRNHAAVFNAMPAFEPGVSGEFAREALWSLMWDHHLDVRNYGDV
ncbi:MAG TPA: RHS repeat-associated core domain-containing protein, partial [Bdellovibrionota bacterium]|nr:RHS repeat-associated core domain-containing protein [Bdellovibrionota bacterium]